LNEYLLLVSFAGGLAAAAGAVAYIATGTLLSAASGIVPKTLPRILRSNMKKNRKQAVEGVNAAFLLGSIAGGILGATFTWGSPAFFNTVGIGSTMGAIIGWFFYNNWKESKRLKLLREVAVLYESVEFYTRAGYTIQQSLKLGAVLAPSLRAQVERCLAAWPSGPARALENFAREVGLSEAAVLSSVLIHAEESGMAFGASAVQEESRNLEELRKNLVELKIASKPLYFAIYRALPMAAVGGVIVGPLVYKLQRVLQMIVDVNL